MAMLPQIDLERGITKTPDLSILVQHIKFDQYLF
jgi:hypothetical protein